MENPSQDSTAFLGLLQLVRAFFYSQQIKHILQLLCSRAGRVLLVPSVKNKGIYLTRCYSAP